MPFITGFPTITLGSISIRFSMKSHGFVGLSTANTILTVNRKHGGRVQREKSLFFTLNK